MFRAMYGSSRANSAGRTLSLCVAFGHTTPSSTASTMNRATAPTNNRMPRRYALTSISTPLATATIVRIISAFFLTFRSVYAAPNTTAWSDSSRPQRSSHSPAPMITITSAPMIETCSLIPDVICSPTPRKLKLMK